jgi:hypothetical protein
LGFVLRDSRIYAWGVKHETALTLQNNACEHNKKRNAANHATDQKHSDEFLKVHCFRSQHSSGALLDDVICSKMARIVLR